MALLGKDEAHKRKIQESREPTEPIYSTAPALNILLTPERPSTSSETPAKIRRKSSSSEKSSWSAESQQSSDKMLAIWIGGSNLPVSAVEDPNMKKYVKTLNSKVWNTWNTNISLSIYSNIFRRHFPLIGSYSRISIRLPSQWLIGSRRLSPRPVVLQQQRTSGVVLSPQIPT